MARWKYTLNSGPALREAIDNEDMTQVVKCLRLCYEELNQMLGREDRESYWSDIEDALVELACFDPNDDEEDNEEMINCWLADFYDFCDDVRVWIGI